MRKKSIQMYTTLDFGIFNGDMMFSVGYTPERLYEELKTDFPEWAKPLDDLVYSECAGLAISRKSRYKGKDIEYIYVFINEAWTGSIEGYLTLAHELLHAVQFKLDPLLDRSKESECEAYTLTHLMSQVLYKLKNGK